MKRNSTIPLSRLTVLLLATLLPATVFAAAKPATPNIVFMLADDLGYGSLSCYGANTDLVRTPNCDRLAREGVRFTDANAPASICSPTRYGVLTGRYCWRTPLKFAVLPYDAPLHIKTNRLTMASMLKKHGYRTAAIGKWHLGYGPLPKTDFTGELIPGPLEIGFDYHFGVPCNHGDITGVYVEDHRVAGLRSRKLIPIGMNPYIHKPFLGLDAPQRVDKDVMPTLTDKAVAWIEEQQSGKPFFLYFTPVAVHEPVTPSDKTAGTSKAGPYGDWIHELDLTVGRVLDVLDKKGFSQNTLVILTSDNGGETEFRGTGSQIEAQKAGLKINGQWRGGKHMIYEGGLREPFIVRWPGKTPAGTVCNKTINLVDMVATLAAVVGEKLPKATVGAEDSFNVLPTFLGKKRSKPLRPDMIGHSADGVFAIRQGDWKYIEGISARPGGNRARRDEYHVQLYNLAKDPGEQNNLAAKHPEIVQRLQRTLNKERAAGHTRK